MGRLEVASISWMVGSLKHWEIKSKLSLEKNLCKQFGSCEQSLCVSVIHVCCFLSLQCPRDASTHPYQVGRFNKAASPPQVPTSWSLVMKTSFSSTLLKLMSNLNKHVLHGIISYLNLLQMPCLTQEGAWRQSTYSEVIGNIHVVLASLLGYGVC